MRVGSELTLLTNCFPDLHATVVGGLTAIHENIILNAGVLNTIAHTDERAL